MTKKPLKKKPAANPLYVKIGKRIRQARVMAKESNSRALSLRLGWSGGRLNNFETGLSTPGIEETLRFCQEVNAEPAWITYGVGSPQSSALQATRYKNLMSAIDTVETGDELAAFLGAVKLSMAGLEKLRANPFSKISNVMARRCEKYFGKPRGWLDEIPIESGYCEPLPPDMRELLEIYALLRDDDRRKLLVIGQVLLGDVEIA